MNDEPEFALSNTAASRWPAQFTNDPYRQRLLLAGLDCMPGQGDLFGTDGERLDENLLPPSA